MKPGMSQDEKGAEVRCTVNGGERYFAGNPMARLLDVLREDWRLTGTKEGCAEGECGACTVWVDGEVVCACLVPIFQVDGRDVRTVEALMKGGELDPIQAAFIEEGGVQCGACTPGMIVTARALLDRNPNPSREEMRESLAGNLCRCTGYDGIYRSILNAMQKGGDDRGGDDVGAQGDREAQS